MTDTQCPPDEDLAPLLAGESVDATLQGHIDGCDSCRRRLKRFETELDDLRTLAPFEAPPLHTNRPRPAMIGKYLIVGTLDSGGQSQVFRALHPTLDKELVIKLSHTPVEDRSDRRHLLIAEGKLLASLDHPNLARVYDLDFHEDLPFLAIEYIRGRTLSQFAAEDRPGPRESARIVAEIARALAVVHRRGITHQDIKPANILIDEEGRPRLIDFGLARIRHAWDDRGEHPSGGTPAFMAPEQARAEDERLGPRSDIFSLGGVLYFLLTGDAPFAADTPMAALKRAQKCDFDRSALHRVPRRLETVVLKAMAERPEDRYARADDLAADLERSAARPRWPARAALAAAAAVLLALGGWAVSHGPGPIPAPVLATFTPDLTINVTRDGQPVAFAQSLPLGPAHDQLQIVARVPPHSAAAMYHLPAHGKVERLSPEASPAGNFTRLVFPGHGQTVPLDPGPAGTEFILVVTAASEDQLRNLESHIAKELGTLPPLLGHDPIRLDRDEPSRQRSSFGVRQQDDTATIEYRLDQLRQQLLGQPGIDTILGVAFGR